MPRGGATGGKTRRYDSEESGISPTGARPERARNADRARENEDKKIHFLLDKYTRIKLAVDDQ